MDNNVKIVNNKVVGVALGAPMQDALAENDTDNQNYIVEKTSVAYSGWNSSTLNKSKVSSVYIVNCTVKQTSFKDANDTVEYSYDDTFDNIRAHALNGDIILLVIENVFNTNWSGEIIPTYITKNINYKTIEVYSFSSDGSSDFINTSFDSEDNCYMISMDRGFRKINKAEV